MEVTHTKRGRRLFAAGTVGATLVALVLLVGHAAFAATLFSDNFDDGNGNGWSKSGGSWSVVSDGSPAYRQSNAASELARVFAGSSGWTDYSVQARVKPLAFDGSGRFVGVAARSNSSTTFVRLVLLNNNRVELQSVKSGTVTVLGGASLTVSVGTWYTLRVEVRGNAARGYVNGNQVASGTQSAAGNGRIVLQTFHATASFDDVSVVTLGSDPDPDPTTPTPDPTDPVPPTTGLVGWATQNGGTTGGAGGSTVTVSNVSALDAALTSSSPLVIRVSGMISLSGMHRVGSNKTVIGVGSNSGITGGGLNVANARNVIIRNLRLTNANDDAINVQYSTNVWIDHNDVSNGYDGAIDIKRASDFVTVSWNHIHDHDKAMLLGHDDGNASEDVGHLRVTYHNNWLDGSSQRHPRVRFGNPVHVFNNYYYNVSGYGIASTEGAGVLVEGNYFENTDDPYHLGEGDSGPGTLVARNNHFVNSGAGQAGGSVASIPYGYTVANPTTVKATVTAGAGVGRI